MYGRILAVVAFVAALLVLAAAQVTDRKLVRVYVY